MTRRWIGWGVCALALCASVFVGLVSADVPGTATLISPAGVVKTARPGFTWTSLAEADEYQLKVSVAGGAVVHQQWYLASICAGGSCSVTPSLALADSAYEWTVQARNASGDGAWATAQGFSVAAVGALGAGFAHSLAADRIGSLWTYGSNSYGQIGDGSATPRLLPTALASPTAIAVAGGEAHSVALRADGRVFAWGRGASGQLGQGSTSDSLTPLEASGLTNVVAVASGKDHVVVLLADGTVKAFGSNSRGQLGDGTTTNRTSPVAVPGLASVVAIAAGANHSLAVKSDGTLYAFGANDVGQLGDGSTADRTAPTQVPGFSNAAAVFSGSAANHSLVVKSDGTAWAFGRNAEGQLGDGSATDRTSPVQMSGLTSVLALAAGEGHTLVVRTDGSVYSTGRNDSGQLGDGTTTARDTTAQVSGLSGIVAIAAGRNHSLALKSDGTVYGFGENQDGQLGNGTSEDVLSPVTLSGSGFTWQAGTPVIGTPAGTYQTDQTVTLTSATAGATIHYTTNGIDPTQSDASVSNGAGVLVSNPGTLKARAYAAGTSASNVSAATYAFKATAPTAQPAAGTWAGPLPVTLQTATTSSEIRYTTDSSEPTGSSTLYAGPLSLAASATVRAKALRTNWQESDELSAAYTIQQAGIAAGTQHSVAVLPDGSVWATGTNGNGQIGDGSTTQRRVPTAVPSLTSGVVAVAAGEHSSYAVLATGAVKAWGLNTNGRLGDGSTTQRTSPVAVGASVPDFVSLTKVVARTSHALALKSNGQVYAWGLNTYGGLGDGSTTQRTSPVLVSGISTATAIAAGDLFSVVLRSDGTVMTLGKNSEGQLGYGSTDSSSHSTAQAIGSAGVTNIVAIAAGHSHALALRSDGTVWAWGRNGNGQLGDGSTTMRPTPQQVPNLTGVVAIAAGEAHSTFLKADGTLWAAGLNSSGQIGDSTQTQRTSPWAVVQVANGVQVAGNRHHALAMTETGEIWSWGSGAQGEIGDGLAQNRLTPVRIAEAGFVWKVGIPVLSVGTGSYQAVQNVTVTTATPAALLHYTSDGSEPDESDPSVASGGVVVVNQTQTLKVKGFKAGLAGSYTTSATYTMNIPNVSISPGGGTFATGQTVTVSCALSGVTIHYTTNGQTPTTSDPTIASGGTLAINQATTLKAMAVRTGWTNSAVNTQTYSFQAAQPVFTPGGGAYSGAQLVTLTTATPGATIHYTTSGIQPTTSDASVASGGTVLIDRSMTFKAIAVYPGWTNSNLAAALYRIDLGPAATPAASPVGGSYSSAQSVTLTTATSGAVIRYTLDGSDPDLQSPLYTAPIAIAASRTLKAKAFLAEHSPSATLSESYDLDGSAVAAPLAVPAGGSYASRRVVTITTATAGATIHYTSDGEDPTESDPTVASGGTLAIDATQRLKLRAFKAGLDPSDVRIEDYVLTGAIATGSTFTLVLKADGTVWAAGENNVGQLGQGVSGDTGTPVQVKDGAGFLTDVIAIGAGGGHALAVKADGTVRSWGSGGYGQLGNNTTTNALLPVTVLHPADPTGNLTSIVAVAASDRSSYFLKADGTAWACGENGFGDLGDTTTTQRKTPVQVAYLTGITQIKAGARGGYALKTDGGPTGTVWAWGLNSLGQIGDGTSGGGSWSGPNGTRTNAVSGLSGVRAIGAGSNNAFAIKPDGSLWAWGHGTGANGDGTFSQRQAPVQAQIANVAAIDGSLGSAVAIDDESRIWTWGSSYAGQLGDPEITGSRAIPGPVPYLRDVVQASGGSNQMLVLKKDGSVWGWGDDTKGQLGDGYVPIPGLGKSHTSPILTLFAAADTTWYLADTDDDGLTNDVELAIGTDPTKADTNGDGVLDGPEHKAGKSATNLDMDGDGLANAAELLAGSDPFIADTDGDGHSDGADAFPIDPTRWQAPAPTPGDTTPPVITLAEPTNATLVSVVPPLP